MLESVPQPPYDVPPLLQPALALLVASIRVVDSIVVHRDILNHEDIVLGWWTSGPSYKCQKIR